MLDGNNIWLVTVHCCSILIIVSSVVINASPLAPTVTDEYSECPGYFTRVGDKQCKDICPPLISNDEKLYTCKYTCSEYFECLWTLIPLKPDQNRLTSADALLSCSSQIFYSHLNQSFFLCDSVCHSHDEPFVTFCRQMCPGYFSSCMSSSGSLFTTSPLQSSISVSAAGALMTSTVALQDASQTTPWYMWIVYVLAPIPAIVLVGVIIRRLALLHGASRHAGGDAGLDECLNNTEDHSEKKKQSEDDETEMNIVYLCTDGSNPDLQKKTQPKRCTIL